jgi:hypothetical protein
MTKPHLCVETVRVYEEEEEEERRRRRIRRLFSSFAAMEGETRITDYRPVKPKKLPGSRSPRAAESQYWKSFSSKNIQKQIASVSCVHFCPEPPYHFAVTSSTRVLLLILSLVSGHFVPDFDFFFLRFVLPSSSKFLFCFATLLSPLCYIFFTIGKVSIFSCS